MILEKLGVVGFVYGPKGVKNPRFVFIAIDDPVFGEIELSQAWNALTYRGYFVFLDHWDTKIVLADLLKFREILKTARRRTCRRLASAERSAGLYLRDRDRFSVLPNARKVCAKMSVAFAIFPISLR